MKPLDYKNPVIQAREERDLSRLALAQKSGMSYYTIANIEKGIGDRMYSNTLKTLAKFFSKDPKILELEYMCWIDSLRIV